MSESKNQLSFPNRKPFSRHLGLVIILAAFAGLGILYDVTVPFFEKADELKHFAVIQHIQTRRQLPVVQEGVYEAWAQEGTQPPLYYILAAIATAGVDLSDFEEPPRNPHYPFQRSFIWRELGNNNLYLHTIDETWRTGPVFLAARLARWLSLLAGLATIALTYKLAQVVFFQTADQSMVSIALLAPAFVAFVPQFLHVSTAVTNDSLSTTLVAAALVVLALVIKDGNSRRYALYLGLILGLGAITKLSLLYLLPVTGLTLLFDFRRRRVINHLLIDGVIIAGFVLLLAGWWYWRNWQLYKDFSAINAHLVYRGGPLDPRPTLAEIWQAEITGLELSFWAAFGTGQILLDPWLYTGLQWVKYFVLIGLIIGFYRLIRHLQLPTHRSQLEILVLLVVWTLIVFAALLRWMQMTNAPWGRLLFPALPALGVLIVWGLSQFCTRSCQFVPPLLLVVVLFILALAVPFRYLQAAYRQTPLITEADIPAAGLKRLDFTYAGALRLIGYRVEKSSVRPGEWLPVTLYWQAIRPIDKNYSAFVHLLGRDNQVIGQVNTYPDGGKWPTSMLKPDYVLPDIYHVPVSAEATAPAVIRLSMGIFEFEDPARTAKVAVNPVGEVVDPIVGAVPLLPRHWPRLAPTHPFEANFANQLRLVGYDWSNSKIEAGDSISITFYWETLNSPDQDLHLFIHLIDASTQAQVAGFDGPPPFPTAFWQSGNTFIDTRQLSLPANLSPGNYTLQIGWYNLDTLARLSFTTESQSGDALQLLAISVVE